MHELVIVGVDGSENADSALRWALRYAQGRDATVRLVTAWTWEQVIGPPGARFPTETEQQAIKRAEEQLDAALERVPRDLLEDVHVDRAVDHRSPAEYLLDQAADADLLVLGSRGRGGFRGLLLGSVSLHCVTHAPCPTVVVPHTDDGS